MDMAALVNSTLDIQEIKRRSVDAAVRLLNSETGSLLLIDTESGELFFEVALKKGERLKAMRLKRGQGIAGWVAEHGVAQIVHDVSSDRRFFRQADQATGFRTRNMVCVPVRTKERMLGVLQAVNKKNGARFSKDDLELLVAFSHHVALAIENALLYKENIQHLEVRLREEKMHAVERERILRDLHDGIGGITTNISLLADLAQCATSLDEVRRALSTISGLSREGLAEIRCFMNCLDEGRMDWDMLVSDIRHYGRTFFEPHGICFQVTGVVEEMEEQPASMLYLSLFRIYKEALANIVKHSGAKNVTVMVDIRSGRLLLSVKDDGKGLDHEKKSGRGLWSMKTRAGEMGGRMSFVSGNGTEVILEVPLPLRYIANE